MSGGTTIVDRLNKLSGKDATTIAKALENVEETGIGGGGSMMLVKQTEINESRIIFDHTWQQIDEALKSGTIVGILFTQTTGDPPFKSTVITILMLVTNTLHYIDGKVTPPVEHLMVSGSFIPPDSHNVAVMNFLADSTDDYIYQSVGSEETH